MPDLTVATGAFRSLLLRSVILPVVVMAALAGALIFQVRSLVSAAERVEHTDEVLARLFRVETAFVDMQAASRGYTLFVNEIEWDRYNAAAARSGRLLDELGALTVDRAEAQTLVRTLASRRIDYTAAIEERHADRRAGRTVTVPTTYGAGKYIMDDIVRLIGTFIAEEEALRGERNARSRRWARIATYGAGFVTLGVGAVLAWFSRTQVRQLSATYEHALARSRELSESLERRVAERTRELEQTNGKLGDANRELEAFSYSISHDLRAPMRHISGFANLMKTSTESTLSPDDADNLTTIQQTAVLAGRMVDDLLAFSRVGRTALRADPIDVNAVVAGCLRDLEPETASRDVQWTIGELRPTVGDTALLRMAFANLLANAVKYTATRDVARIEVDSRAEDAGTTYFIRDNGVGFDMAYAHKLFGVFQRLHRAEEFEGTGIGLANVRRIILRHGGRVWAEGVHGSGATFFVHLPDRGPSTIDPTDPTGVTG